MVNAAEEELLSYVAIKGNIVVDYTDNDNDVLLRPEIAIFESVSLSVSHRLAIVRSN